MAAIKITALSPVQGSTTNSYTYKDLHLDMRTQFSDAKNSQLFKIKEQNDLVADYDRDAIRNSISNLFNTSKGERVLVPDYGLNLKKYLFMAVTKQNAMLIGDEIKTGIGRWEPRVSVESITIVTDEDNNTYQIALTISIGLLQKTTATLPGILSNSGFQFIV